MPIYIFQHPKTGETFEELRSMKNSDKSFIAPDGVECKRVISNFAGWKGNREIFELDPGFVKKNNPKYIKFKDGHRERYDSTKHC